MAFTQETFAPVATNSTDAQAIYSYRSDDDISTVTSAGYFDIKKLQLNEKDWIMCELSDGIVIVQIGADTSTASVIFSPSPGLCSITTLTNYGIGGSQTVAINNATNQVVATSQGFISNSIQATTESYQSTNAQVGQEVVWDGFTGVSAGSFGLGLSDSAVPTASPIIGVLVDPVNGLIIDVNAGPIAFGQAVTVGYWGHMIMDTNLSGSASYNDSLGNNLSLTVAGTFNNANPIYQGSICNASPVLGDKMTVSYNAGWKAWNSPSPGSRWCNV